MIGLDEAFYPIKQVEDAKARLLGSQVGLCTGNCVYVLIRRKTDENRGLQFVVVKDNSILDITDEVAVILGCVQYSGWPLLNKIRVHALIPDGIGKEVVRHLSMRLFVKSDALVARAL